MAAHTTPDLDTYAETTIHHKVGRLIGHHGFRAQDREDLEQELALAVIERLQGFKAQQVQRNTYIAKVIDQRIADLIRYRERECRNPIQDVELDDPDSETVNNLDSLPDPNSERPQKIADLRMDMPKVIAGLTPRQQVICRLITKTDQADVRRHLNISRWILAKELLAIRKSFTDAGIEP